MAKTIRVSAFSTSGNEALMIPEEALVIPGYEPYRIPKNWCWTRTDSICRIFTGDSINERVKAEKYTGRSNGYVYIATKDIGFDSTIDYETNVRIPKEEKFKIAPKNTTLLCIEGGSAGRKIGFVTQDVCFVNKLCAFVPNKRIFPKYLYYTIQSEAFKNQFDEKKHGLIGGVSLKEISSIYIPLIPFNEQIAIVAKIESLFSKLDKAKEKAQEILDAFEVRKASILHKAFTGELTTEWRKENGITGNAYSKRRFDEVAEIKSNLVDPADYQNYPHIAPDNIEKKTGVLLDYHTIEEDGVKSGKHLFYPGQILYSKIRPNLSKIVVVDFKGLCSADMYPIEAKGDAKCLWYYMLSEEFLEQASSAGSRSVLPKINQKELSRLKVSLPASIDEQKEISRTLDTLLERELQSKQTAEMVINQIDIMKKSILAQAFRGELGTNNPNDENAEELLKRILSEKAKEANEQPKVKRTRIVIPEEIENLLQTNLEREIIKLFYKSETKEAPEEDVMSVSSRAFDNLDAVQSLEEKKLIKKSKDGIYKLLR